MQDLSQPIDTGMTTYPDDPEVRVEPAATYPEDDCRVESVSCGSHTGTHVDAPGHTEAEGRTLDSYAVADFVFDTLRVDCRDLDAREPIPPERVPDGDAAAAADCVVFWTDWDDHWNTDRYLDHPYLPPEAADRCAEQGLAVGTDTLNPDPTPTENAAADEPEGFAAHHALLGSDCLILENLTNLGAVDERFELRAYPLKLGGDGAPVRAVGVSKAD